MGKFYADLHLHSNHSDGTDSPADMVQRAAGSGLKAIALTDHDTLTGIPEAAAAARQLGITFVPGVEISGEFQGVEIHILGLGVRSDSAALNASIERLTSDRAERAVRIVARLRELEVPITMEDVQVEAGEHAAAGRLHIARALHTRGVTKSVQAGFDRYLGVGKPAYVRKERLPAEEAVDLIHGAGGIAVIAHPELGGVRKKMTALLMLPFDGIEAFHPEHTPGRCSEFLELASGHDLLVSGGSDDHGSRSKRKTLGTSGLAEEAFVRVIKAINSLQN